MSRRFSKIFFAIGQITEDILKNLMPKNCIEKCATKMGLGIMHQEKGKSSHMEIAVVTNKKELRESREKESYIDKITNMRRAQEFYTLQR